MFLCDKSMYIFQWGYYATQSGINNDKSDENCIFMYTIRHILSWFCALDGTSDITLST